MRFTRSTAVLSLVLVLLASGCSSSSDQPPSGASGSVPAGASHYPLTLTDDDGQKLTFQHAPMRIVTFAPSVTEIVYALGLGSRVIGVSGSYDNYPAAAKKVEEVGGAGDFGVDPNLEKVVSLQPDVFLTISGGEEWKAKLRELGVPVFTIQATTLEDTIHDVRTVGTLTGATAAADEVAVSMEQQVKAVEARVAGTAPVSCFYEVYYGPPIDTVGPGSFVYDLLQKAGCDPVTSSAKTAYPRWSAEALLNENPDVYLVDSLSAPNPAAVAKRPGFDALSAVRDGSVDMIDSDLVTRQGPRVVQGLAELARALHPDAFA
jgi:iron complex transport system substrate-binding protein